MKQPFTVDEIKIISKTNAEQKRRYNKKIKRYRAIKNNNRNITS